MPQVTTEQPMNVLTKRQNPSLATTVTPTGHFSTTWRPPAMEYLALPMIHRRSSHVLSALSDLSLRVKEHKQLKHFKYGVVRSLRGECV